MTRSVIGHAAIRQMEIEHLRRSRESERFLSELSEEAKQNSDHRLSGLRIAISDLRSGIGPLTGFLPRRRGIARIR